MFGNKQVQISLNDNLTNALSHGKLWARPVKPTTGNPIGAAMQEGYQAINFRADRPERLANPGRSTIRSIYEQAKLLGLELLHVEVIVKGELKLYAHP